MSLNKKGQELANDVLNKWGEHFKKQGCTVETLKVERQKSDKTIDQKGAKLQFKFPDGEWVDLRCAEMVDFSLDDIELVDPTKDITGVDFTFEASFDLEFAPKGTKEHLIRFISKKWFNRYSFDKFHKTMIKLSEGDIKMGKQGNEKKIIALIILWIITRVKGIFLFKTNITGKIKKWLDK